MAAGVVARLLLRYEAADLTLEAAFVAGLIAGPYAGAMVGACMGLSGLLVGEFGALPFAVGCGFAGGGIREACPKEEIWSFSPFIFFSLPAQSGGSCDACNRLAGSASRWRWSALELLRLALGGIGLARPAVLPARRFGLCSPRRLRGAVLAVATPIKIWNNARIEHRLQEQEKLLLAAKIEALASQINPHFLFNTLTSISSLIRSEPETARTLITKLSRLLRKLLRSHEHFVTLREELEAVDEYLDDRGGAVRAPSDRRRSRSAPTRSTSSCPA